ncbi:coenzyme F420 hydrogenase subunit beta [Desulfocicer vacuolatum DSM 3385]|uniref:Coenzyme F420 hydrogenase subunit beta n=1 Tax=Desulfocicer vacuolatum DSM 3385 TaxID=1121400 RepID=A0A1W2BK14_9BACT|nr:Coenzyme F420 hydrogenase/dehydrogenase, beta subunit C-terminal domain [Desulfocicer vacuolatum]SMC73022.1 coenzyme F420 hydrogenase subunit beta [Desulfocicer vacuolatum DSM 3385]
MALNPKKNNVSKIVSDYLCNSCGACYAVCKQGAIKYHETIGGYLFPKVDGKKCIFCGLCYEVCPGIHFNKCMVSQMSDNPFVGKILSCYVGRASNKEIFNNSQSGGIVTAFLIYLLKTRQISAAIVATMQTNISPRGQVTIATSVEELIKSQKSKYIPIPMLSVINQVKKFEKPVAFVGLPCHMHGLNNLFDFDPELKSKILIKIGLVCDRVLTNAAVDFLGQSATNLPIKNLIFRDKQCPNYPGNPVIIAENGDKIILNASLRMAIKNFFTPVRCRLCFDKLNIFSDVTLGDPHGLEGINRKLGESMIMIRTKTGHNIFDAILDDEAIAVRQIDYQNAITGQHINDKKIQWISYIEAWKQLERQNPNFFKLLKINFSPILNNKKYLRDLSYSLALDNFNSREELLNYVRMALKRKKKLSLFCFPLHLIKRFVKFFLTVLWYPQKNSGRDNAN